MHIKNLNINKDKIKLCTSCVLIATTTALTMKVTNIGLPFYIDNTKHQVYNVRIISSDADKINYTTTKKNQNFIYYYEKWQPGNKDETQRMYKVYKLNSSNEEELINAIEKIKRNLIKPIEEGIEYKLLLSDEEITEEEHWQAFIYDKTDDNYVIIRENNIHNFITSLIYTITTIGICAMPYSHYKYKMLEKKRNK